MSTTVEEEKSVFPNSAPHRPSRLEQLRVKPWLRPPAPRVTLINCKVIDTNQGALLDGLQTIVLEGGSVVSVEPSKSEQKGEGVIDVGGKFVCPGLIDAHVHVAAVPGSRVSRQSRWRRT
jgi:imidazolonepropionase-like amidohydrolase